MNEQLSREEYKARFLAGERIEGKRATVTITRQTKNKLRQLCTAADGRRVATGGLVEKIVDEHCKTHASTIEELYRHDIPY